MKRGRLFVAYHFYGKGKGEYSDDWHGGFENLVGHRLMYAPQDEDMLIALKNECRKHCMELYNFQTAKIAIINWKVMDGD